MKMVFDPLVLLSDIQSIKNLSPLIHNITNYVVMEHTANTLLAIGASPIMAHAKEEVEEMTNLSNSLVLNIGTLSPSWIQSMLVALEAAYHNKIPVVFDPVGTGATCYRSDTAQSILQEKKITAIRGNASEISALAQNEKQKECKGVDSLLNASDCIKSALSLAAEKKCIVSMSGSTDVITDGSAVLLVHNGHPYMSKATGMGCAATALAGAFLAVNANHFLACVHAAILIGISGEIAAEKASGPGSFKVNFIDTLYSISQNDISYHEIEKRIRVEIL